MKNLNVYNLGHHELSGWRSDGSRRNVGLHAIANGIKATWKRRFAAVNVLRFARHSRHEGVNCYNFTEAEIARIAESRGCMALESTKHTKKATNVEQI